MKPQKRGGLGFFALTESDKEGQACYDEYLFSKYSNMSEKELYELTKKGAIFNDIPYFALCSRYFKNHSEELRENVDDQFKSKFEDHINYYRNIGASDEDIKKTRSIEESLRKQLTRKALDILCKKGDAKDLDRIRKNMRSEFVKSSENEIEYMRKQGEWEDVPFIVKAEKDYASFRTSLTIISIDHDWSRSIAVAIYNIGKDRLGELFEIEMPSTILVDLIRTCASFKFSEVSDDALVSLLNSKDDKVRKISSLKSIQSLKKSKLRSLLKDYVEGQESEYRYYNVIFWLDLGVSMPTSITRKTINLISNE